MPFIDPNPNALPKTGQTTEYTSGDDGTYQTGWSRTARFTDAGDGTVYDHATGLWWVKEPQLIVPGPIVAGIPHNQIQSAEGEWSTSIAYELGDLIIAQGAPPPYFYVCVVAHTSGVFADDLAAGKWRQTVWTASAANLTTPKTDFVWDDVLPLVEALEYAGFSDWRMPNVLELLSIKNFGPHPPHYSAFPNTANAFYCTSTTYAGSTSYAYYVSFGGDTSAADIPKAMANVFAIRPVRGGIING